MHRTRRLAVIVLSLALIAPWGASAAVSAPEAGREAAASLWSWLTRLWAEIGCSIDPSGCAGTATGDVGCGLDPSGCKNAFGAAGEIDAGCRLDPNGCAGAAASGDNGCRADPSGAACRDHS